MLSLLFFSDAATVCATTLPRLFFAAFDGCVFTFSLLRALPARSTCHDVFRCAHAADYAALAARYAMFTFHIRARYFMCGRGCLSYVETATITRYTPCHSAPRRPWRMFAICAAIVHDVDVYYLSGARYAYCLLMILLRRRYLRYMRALCFMPRAPDLRAFAACRDAMRD